MSRADDAYGRLVAAYDQNDPACIGLEMFTADDISKQIQAEMAETCAACPIVTLCAEYAALAKPKAGFWAGRLHRTYNKGGAE